MWMAAPPSTASANTLPVMRQLRSCPSHHGIGVAHAPYDVRWNIFDEAHQLEDIATGFFGVRVSRARVDSMLATRTGPSSASGLADRILGRARGRRSRPWCASPRTRSSMQLASLGGAPPAAGDRRRGPEPRSPRDAWSGELLDAYHRLDDHAGGARGVRERERDQTRRCSSSRNRAAQLRAGRRARIVDPATNQVTWVEVRGRDRLVRRVAGRSRGSCCASTCSSGSAPWC